MIENDDTATQPQQVPENGAATQPQQTSEDGAGVAATIQIPAVQAEAQ